MNSENSFELKAQPSGPSHSAPPPAQTSCLSQWWQRIRLVVLIIFTIGWCILLAITIKTALNDNALHESELKNIQNIASILFKLADFKILPVSEAGSDPNNLDYLLRELNERNISKTSSTLLQPG